MLLDFHHFIIRKVRINQFLIKFRKNEFYKVKGVKRINIHHRVNDNEQIQSDDIIKLRFKIGFSFELTAGIQLVF